MKNQRRDTVKKHRFKRRVFRLMPNRVICYLCERPLLFKTSTVDHYVPLNEGGEDDVKNYEIACVKCNGLKADKFPSVRMRRQRQKNRIPDHVRYPRPPKKLGG